MTDTTMQTDAPRAPAPRRAHVLASVGQLLAVLAVLAAGLLGARALSLSGAAPPTVDRPEFAPLVTTETIEVGDVQLSVDGFGTLTARSYVTLATQVSGRVEWIAPALRAGGRFESSQVLVRLERVDQELALAQARADVAAASTGLQNEEAEARAARAEWQALNPEVEAPTLVSREPQIAEARARLESAEARVDQAELALARTELSLPFAGCVVESRVEAGDLVAAGQALGRVYDVSVFEVPVPLADHELSLIEIPGVNAEEGSAASVRIRLAGKDRDYPGRVVRLEGELDPRSRLGRAVVELRPGASDASAETPPPVPGAFADVRLFGRTLEDVVRVPRSRMRDEGRVWLERAGQLVFVTPSVLHEADDAFYVRGLPQGAEMITSDLDVATDGMTVRTRRGSR